MNCHPVLSVTLLFMFVYFLKQTKAEYYSAIADLGKLLGSVEKILKVLEAYQRSEEEKLAKVKWLTEQYGKIQKAANEDTETFLTNPINAYLLIKRLSYDLDIARNSDNQDFLSNLTPEIEIPTTDDLEGASSALLRLQSTFLLDTASLARGDIKGSYSFTTLSAGDCLELGRQAIREFYYKYALDWLEESMERLEKEDGLKTANEAEILEYMAYAHSKLHNYSKAVEITERILDLDPLNPRAPNNLFMYWKAGEEYEAQKGTKEKEPEDLTKKDWPKEYLSPALVDAFEKLCRGESTKTSAEQSRLYCYETDNGNSYLTLQPIKTEILHFNPRIVMYYDVLRESEADTIKSVALPQLSRAVVINGTSGKTGPASYRVSKSAWLFDDDHPIIPKIDQRVEAISGLDIEYAEPLHAINYGIGGHYNPHIDFAREGNKVSYLDDLGNRLATWIFYLSHVSAGGSTVFPNLGVEVKPIKGAAAFWYNLYRNGTGNEDTIHAACPVLTGSKWVANKWLHENGNEFRRSCALNQLK